MQKMLARVLNNFGINSDTFSAAKLSREQYEELHQKVNYYGFCTVKLHTAFEEREDFFEVAKGFFSWHHFQDHLLGKETNGYYR